MPIPRKVDLLPAELTRWLEDSLRASGFGGYEALAEALTGSSQRRGWSCASRKAPCTPMGPSMPGSSN